MTLQCQPPIDCEPPLAGPCTYPAAELVRVRAAFLPPAETPSPLCSLHLGLWTGVGIDVEVLAGPERDAALGVIARRACAVPDCDRAPAPCWSRCDAHAAALIAGAFGPDHSPDAERWAGIRPPVPVQRWAPDTA